MKIIFLNSYASKGGAARAALRLAEALTRSGVDVEYKNIYPEKIGILAKLKYYFRVAYDRFPSLLAAQKKIMFSSGGIPNKKIIEYINESDADIVHLHWINAGGIAISDISKIRKPIFWTLHDNWPFTGGCHVMWDCENYKSSCGKCPKLKSEQERDLSWHGLKKKLAVYESAKSLSIIGVSNWISACAKESKALSNHQIITIPNAIDSSFFYPIPKVVARQSTGLPNNKKIILFGANSATKDPNKGFSILVEALSKIQNKDDIELIVFGNPPSANNQVRGISIKYLGPLKDNKKLQLLYCAADTTVVPSLQESFGQTATESMACGTPVVAFAATGLLDIVDHKVNGYLAKPFDPKSLANGIMWVLKNPDKDSLSKNARLKIESTFDYSVVVKQHVKAYADLLAINRTTSSRNLRGATTQNKD